MIVSANRTISCSALEEEEEEDDELEDLEHRAEETRRQASLSENNFSGSNMSPSSSLPSSVIGVIPSRFSLELMARLLLSATIFPAELSVAFETTTGTGIQTT
jgi:hypothetical protein